MKKEKARPVVVISNDLYNSSKREDLLVLAISGSQKNKLSFEPEIEEWQEAGLLKPSILKASIATIDQSLVIQKLGSLAKEDQNHLNQLLELVIG